MTAGPSIQYVDAVSNLLIETRNYLDQLRLIPRRSSKPDAVLLALASKSIVLAESVVLLVSKGFHDESFGLCRTLLELELTVRYLTNTETDDRCDRYVEYFAKVNEGWMNIATKYYPDMSLGVRADAEELEKLAENYKSPHRWSKHDIKYFASEPDSFEKKEDGTPLDELFYYEVLYKWMSYYVHVAEHAVSWSHATDAGDIFKIHPGEGRSTRGEDSLRLSYQLVRVILFRVFRYLNMEFPPQLQNLWDQILQDHAKAKNTAKVASASHTAQV